MAESHRDSERARSQGRGRAQDHGAHPLGARRTRLGSQPDALPLRIRRRLDHARARHARAALLSVERGGEVRRGRQLRSTQPRDAAEPHGRRVFVAARRFTARVPRRGVPGDRRRVAFSVRLRTRRRRFRVALHARGERFLAPSADAGHRGGRAEHALLYLPRAPPDARRLRLRRRRRRHVRREEAGGDPREDGRDGG